jgi:cation diffusion facilitator family transporter
MVQLNLSKYIPDYGSPTDPEVRAKYGYLEAGVSIIGNFILFIIKLFLGIFINSIALIADSIHTLSDVGTSILIIFGFRMAKKPADENHPYGHARMEYVATLIMTVLLFLAGIGFIWQSFLRFTDLSEFFHGEYAIIIGLIIIISAVIKELMAQYSMALSKVIKSDVLVADAWHHRSDAFASVAVGFGIIGSNLGLLWLDPLFGIVVSLIIIYVGYKMFMKTSNILIGTAPDVELIDKIRSVVLQIEEGKNVDRINVHDYGTTKVVSLHLCVDKSLTVDESSRIADKIENLIMNELGYHSNIRIEPRKVESQPEQIHNIINRYMELFDINQVRAENLFNAGYKKLEDLQDAIPEDLMIVEKINPTIAKRIVTKIKSR